MYPRIALRNVSFCFAKAFRGLVALPEIISAVWKRRWLAILGIAIVVALSYVLTPIVLGPKVPVYAVAQSELVQTVVASGT
jgi:hypothetical protein